MYIACAYTLVCMWTVSQMYSDIVRQESHFYKAMLFSQVGSVTKVLLLLVLKGRKASISYSIATALFTRVAIQL